MLIELKSYQYGEHKILQLVGPSWNIFISATLLVLLSKFNKPDSCNTQAANYGPIKLKYFSVSLLVFLLTIYVSADYLKRSISMLRSMAHYHTIKYDDQNIA